jgi:hypothetical protein
MCPVCMMTSAMLVAGIATPAAALTALLVKKFGAKIVSSQMFVPIPCKENSHD